MEAIVYLGGIMTAEIILSNPSPFEPSFINQVLSNMDVSTKTRADYQFRLGRFKAFCLQHGMNRNTILEYKRSLAADNTISVATKNKYLIVARCYVQQLFRLGLITVDIGAGIKGFRVGTAWNMRGFTGAEVKRIIVGLNASTDIRLKAILSLQMFAGFRCCEITRLMVEHVSLTDAFIQVLGKGRDGLENLPLVPQVVQVLKDYLNATKKKSGFLFTSQSKRNHGSGMTTKSIWLIVRQFLDSLGIHRNPHQCRSFYVSQLVKGPLGNNLFNVIQLTRHASIQTLQSYVDMKDRENMLPSYEQSFSDFKIS